MKTGLSTCGKTVNEEFFASCAEAGIDCIELTLHYRAYSDYDYAGTVALAEKHNVEIWSCHLPFMPFETVDISSSDGEIRSSTVAFLKDIIGRAGEAGIKRFIVHPSAEPIDETERAARLAYARKSLSELQDEADKYGAVICAEDLPRTCIGRNSYEIRELIKDDPRLMVCFDTNHLLGEYIREFIVNVGARIATVHISDYDFVNERHWLPGEGKIDWRELYDTLVSVGYAGPWLYEIGYSAPASIVRERPLTPADFVRNAREIAENLPLTVPGTPIPNLPFWV